MTTYALSPPPTQKFFDNNGRPLANGLLFTYIAGTTTKQATYKNSTGTPNDNPIQLNARGECDLWLPPNVAYDFTLAPAGDTDPPSSPIKTVEDVSVQQLVTLWGGTDTGSADTYALNFSAPFSNYEDGTVIFWIAAHTNTGDSTLNVNGLGPVHILNGDGSTLAAGQIQANSIIQVIYQTGQFTLLQTSFSTLISGRFTPTWGGFTGTPPTGDMLFQLHGGQITLKWLGSTGTSTDHTLTIGNLPTQLRPAGGTSSLVGMVACPVVDNGTRVIGSMGFGGTSTLQFNMGSPLSGTGFTNSGAKGLDTGWSVTYMKGS